MIHRLAAHRLQKLRSSKIIWAFVIVSGFLALVTLLPVIVMAAMSGVNLGSETAARFFQFLIGLGHIAALILGVTTWRQDYRDGTMLTFAARPLSRIEMLIGKILGSFYALLAFLAVALAIYALFHLIFLRFPIPAATLLFLLQTIFSWISTFAIGLFFSNFSGPLLATVFGVIYFIVSALGAQLAELPRGLWPVIGKGIKLISVERDLGFSFAQVMSADLPGVAPMLKACAYYLLWALCLICASILLFARREFIGKRS